MRAATERGAVEPSLFTIKLTLKLLSKAHKFGGTILQAGLPLGPLPTELFEGCPQPLKITRYAVTVLL